MSIRSGSPPFRANGTESALAIWVGEMWAADVEPSNVVRITMLDRFLGVVDAETCDGVATAEPLSQFLASHHRLDKDPTH